MTPLLQRSCRTFLTRPPSGRGLIEARRNPKRIAGDLQLAGAELALHLKTELAKYVNKHAWALVRLQQNGLIQKLAPKTYIITRQGRASLRQTCLVRP